MDMSKYKAMFISESQEHLTSMNQCLVKLEANAKDQEAVAEAFRNAHSIKGMAASMGYQVIRDLAHAMEDLMDDFRGLKREPDPENLDILFQGLDALETLVKDVEQDREPTPAAAALVQAMRGQPTPGAESAPPAPAVAAAPEAPTPAPFKKKALAADVVLDAPEISRTPRRGHPGAGAPASETGPIIPAPGSGPEVSIPGPSRAIRVVFSAQTAAPGVRGLILFKRLGELGEIKGSRPSFDEVKAGNFLADPKGLAVEIDLVGESSEDEIVHKINSIADVASFELLGSKREEPPAVPEEAPESRPSPVLQDQGRIESPYDPFAQVQSLPQTVRVKTAALDRFISALGEMIMVKSELREVAKHNPLSALEAGLDRLDRLIRDFHDQVMTIRMMPLESVVQRLPRVVRDLAKEEGKKIKFEVKGGDIELDRAILEQLGDPLIHLLRNAVNHGVEPPAERTRLGKREEGKIELEAYRQRDMILIDIRDDGRGMDPFALKETAVAKGLKKPEEAEKLTDEDALQLIFAPGFSTAKEVGLVSGRGVGMDVVKSVTESVGGFVTVSTAIGKGASFTLHLPRTIAIVNVLLVQIAQEIFGIPIAKIQKTVEILPHQLRRTANQKFYLERQEMIPVKALHRFLNLPEPEEDSRAPRPALIVETHNRRVALIVDDLVGQEEAFIRPLGKPLELISGLSGVTMLGDGRVVFVLDTMSLI